MLRQSLEHIKAEMADAKARSDHDEVSRLIDLGIKEGWRLVSLYDEVSSRVD